jgi:hypothetical protein
VLGQFGAVTLAEHDEMAERLELIPPAARTGARTGARLASASITESWAWPMM